MIWLSFFEVVRFFKHIAGKWLLVMLLVGSGVQITAILAVEQNLST